MGNNNGIKIQIPGGRLIKTRNYNQTQLIESIQCDDVIVASGPAGTGKTFIAVAAALDLITRDRRYERLILTRPAVDAGEHIGFLPGDSDQKLQPYVQPLIDSVKKVTTPEGKKPGRPKDWSNIITILPLGFVRGLTFEDSIVILDEAQNTTVRQIKMFLTRLGARSKIIITGDPDQSDLPYGMENGLEKAIDLLHDIKGISIIKFTDEDIVRHHLVKQILKKFGNSK